MDYHYVMTVVAQIPGGQQYGFVSRTIELEEGDPTQETVFWSAFTDACEQGSLKPSEAVVVFWSMQPDRTG